MKSLIVTKIVQKIKFKGDWGKLEAKQCFQRQSWTMSQKIKFKGDCVELEAKTVFRDNHGQNICDKL